MCDEYDDERMRAFWRQLAMQEELAKLEPEPETSDEIGVRPLSELEPKRAKREALLH